MISLAAILLGGITVTLPMEVKVRGTELTLGDVAQISGEDAGLVATARRVQLGSNPAPGYSRLIADSWIEQRLRRDLPDVEITLVGQRNCRVWPLVERIPAEQLRIAAENEVKRLIATEDATYELSTPISEMLVPAGIEGAVVRVNVPTDRVSSGSLSVPIQVMVDGTPYRTLWTTFDVRVWQTVPVLRRNVRAGERLTDDHFERRRVPRSESQRGAPLPVEALFGAIASRDILAGSAVTGADVHRSVAIEQGRPIIVQVRKGTITARIAGTARDTGRIGDRIRVITFDKGAELVGIVRSREMVEIDLGG